MLLNGVWNLLGKRNLADIRMEIFDDIQLEFEISKSNLEIMMSSIIV